MASNPHLQRYALHGIPLHFQIDDPLVVQRVRHQWRGFPTSSPKATMHAIRIHLYVNKESPTPPDFPIVGVGPGVTYYRRQNQLVVLADGARFDVQLNAGRITGALTPAWAAAPGVLEEMLLVSMAPLLRRRRHFVLHAFAVAQAQRALLLVGASGAGKSTTGVSLLARGAKLLANDAPLLFPQVDGEMLVRAFPGPITLFSDSIARFPTLQVRLPHEPAPQTGKRAIDPASIWPDVWQMQARPHAIVLPTLEPGLHHSWLEALSPIEVLHELLATAMEQWDRAMIPAHLRALRRLAASATGWRLHLAPDLPHIPDLLLPLLQS